VEDKEGDEEGEEPSGEDEVGEGDEGNNYISQFNKRWGWFDWAVTVKEIMSVRLDEVFNVNVVEFLNILCYKKDKCAMEYRQQEEYLKKARK
jgi:hypothetical protein